MFLNKFIYFALYQKHLLKVSTSCLSKDGDNIITKYKIQYNDKNIFMFVSRRCSSIVVQICCLIAKEDCGIYSNRKY